MTLSSIHMTRRNHLSTKMLLSLFLILGIWASNTFGLDTKDGEGAAIVMEDYEKIETSTTTNGSKNNRRLRSPSEFSTTTKMNVVKGNRSGSRSHHGHLSTNHRRHLKGNKKGNNDNDTDSGDDNNNGGMVPIIIPSGNESLVRTVGVPLPRNAEMRFDQKLQFFNVQDEMKFRDTRRLLTARDYPLNDNLYNVLSEQTNGVSIVQPDDFEMGMFDVEELIERVAGGHPPHAPTRKFWPLLEEVVDYQLYRRQFGNVVASSNQRGNMSWLNLPQLWKDFTNDQVAEAVNAEYPNIHQSRYLEELFREGGVLPDNTLLRRRSAIQFLHTYILWVRFNGWVNDLVGTKTFASKWFVGRARPEEVAWTIHCTMVLVEADEYFAKMNQNPTSPMSLDDVFERDERIEQCRGATTLLDLNVVPTSLKTKIARLKLTNLQSDFGAYRQGSPVHPAWPAMHSSGSTLSVWLPIVTSNLSEEQWDEAKRTDLAVAMARTVAGVHYRDDNLAGLKMGQYIVEQTLPSYMEQFYGSDPNQVRRKIQKFHFNWDDEFDRLIGSTPF